MLRSNVRRRTIPQSLQAAEIDEKPEKHQGSEPESRPKRRPRIKSEPRKAVRRHDRLQLPSGRRDQDRAEPLPGRGRRDPPAAPKYNTEQAGADPAGEGDRCGNTDLRVGWKESKREHDGAGETGERGPHRGARILVAERDRAEDFLQHVPRQPGCHGGERGRNRGCILRPESAALEQCPPRSVAPM